MKKEVRRTYILIGLFLLFVLLHNFVSAVLDIEEVIFFLCGLLSGVLFILSVLYTTLLYIRQHRPQDLWTLGWLGLLGLVGFLPNFGPMFFGLYGFFGYFGLKTDQ